MSRRVYWFALVIFLPLGFVISKEVSAAVIEENGWSVETMPITTWFKARNGTPSEDQFTACTDAMPAPYISSNVLITHSNPRTASCSSGSCDCEYKVTYSVPSTGSIIEEFDPVLSQNIVNTYNTCPAGFMELPLNGEPICKHTMTFFVAANPPNNSGSCEGNPCDPATGGKYQTEVDITFTGGGLEFRRSYQSLGLADHASDMGGRWHHNYSQRMDNIPDMGEAYVYKGISSIFYATPQDACEVGWSSYNGPAQKGYRQLLYGSQGVYQDGLCKVIANGDVKAVVPVHSNAAFKDSYRTVVGENYRSFRRPGGNTFHFLLQNFVWEPVNVPSATLTQIPNGWQLITGAGITEIYDDQGLLQTSTNLQGLEKAYSYNSNGQLQNVTDHLGRQLGFSYDGQGRLGLVSSSMGDVAYIYDANGNLNTASYPDGTSRTYLYENINFPYHMTGIIDESGVRYATWTYDSEGLVTSSEHAGGVERVDLTYNADKTTTVTDSRGASRTYSFEVVNGQVKVNNISGDACPTCVNGQMKQRTYDALGYLTSFTDWNNVTTQYGSYDAKGQYGYKVEAVGMTGERRVDYTYDSRFINKVASITELSVYSGNNKVTIHVYDSFGNRTRTSIAGYRPDGTSVTRTTTYQYNNSLNQLSQIDGSRTDVSDITTLAYYANDVLEGDNRARLKSIAGSENIILRSNIQYSATGKVLSEDRPNGLSIVYTYYAGNNRLEILTKTNGGSSRTTRWTYLATGEVESITQGYGIADASIIVLGYDDARRLTRITDGMGNYLEYTLDTEGNITGENTFDSSGVLQKTLSRTFDIYNRLDQLTQPNQLIDYNFNVNGTLGSMQDGNSQLTTYGYDDLKRITSTSEVGGETTQYNYDANTNLSDVTDSSGNSTNYIVDDLGNQLQQVSPDTGTTNFTYDAAGNVISKSDANGNIETYSYDALNRITGTDRIGTDYDDIYNYDNCTNGIGKLCSVANGLGEGASYTYSAHGKVASATGTQGTVAYGYDAVGRVFSITYPSGVIVGTSYDAAGQVNDVWLDESGVISSLVSNIQYKAFGPAEQLSYGNGLVTTNTHDLQYWLRNTALSGGAGSIWSQDYNSYDGNGNLLQTGTDGALSNYNYDALDRLDAANDPFGSLVFDYDPVGNRTLLTNNGSDTPYIYEANNNRLASEGAWIYTRDAVGNTLSKLDNNGAGFTYAYTPHHRLASASEVTLTPGKGKGKNSTPTITEIVVGSYTYNPMGQRVSKNASGSYTGYVYGLSGELLAEVASDGTVKVEYIYLNGQPLAMRTAGGSATQPSAGVEVIINNGDATTASTGTWGLTSSKKAYLGDYQLGTGDSGSTYRWTPTLSGGNYDVYAWWVANKRNNNPAAQYTVLHNGITETVSADQTTNGGKWVLLGNYDFSGDGSEFVELSDAGGRVVADAVRFVQSSAAPAPITGMTLHYLHTDHLGTPRRATDSTGTVVWSWDSDAFGAVSANDDPDGDGVAIVVNLRFPGQYYDGETGLHYNYFRYYDPSTGRYITSDPIGLIAGTNTYAYVYQNPLRWTDLSGLLTATTGGTIRVPSWVGWLARKLFDTNITGQGFSGGLAIQFTDDCGNFAPDIGAYVSASAGGADLGIGRLAVNLGLHQGTIGDLSGSGHDVSLHWGLVGGTANFDGNGDFSGGSIDLGVGYNLGIAGSISDSWSASDNTSGECGCSE